MENLVVTLETAKKLKAAGFEPEEPILGWQQFEGTWIVMDWTEVDEDFEWYFAPSAQEIADQLPHFELSRSFFTANGERKAFYVVNSGCDADTMAEALALLWLKLQEGK